MKLVSYLAFRAVCGLFYLLPFRLIFILSDVLAFILRNIIPYRRAMITNNLRLAFPEKSEAEIRRIRNAFYKSFCDIMLETVKGFSMPADEIRKRYVFDSTEALNRCFDEGKSAIGASAHLGNWEWGAYGTGLNLKHHVIGIYKKLSHELIDAYMIRARGRFGITLCEMADTARTVESRKKGSPFLLILIADQRPHKAERAHWTSFLGRDTAFLRGIDALSAHHDMPVFFLNIRRVKRGYYRIAVEELRGNIIESFKSVLEREIRIRPEEWLWSHNRWKHSRPVSGTVKV